MATTDKTESKNFSIYLVIILLFIAAAAFLLMDRNNLELKIEELNTKLYYSQPLERNVELLKINEIDNALFQGKTDEAERDYRRLLSDSSIQHTKDQIETRLTFIGITKNDSLTIKTEQNVDSLLRKAKRNLTDQ